MKHFSKSSLIHDLSDLGVSEGDIIFIAADLLRVGYFNCEREKTYSDWIDILLDLVGEKGTLVVPAYTNSFYRFKKNKTVIFNKKSPTNSGGLSMAFQKDQRVKRSKHPTNSCFAIGKDAEYILDGHDENASSYLPYSKIIELGGKNLMLGAFHDTKLSPMAMHAAQEALGLTSKHFAAGLIQSYFEDDCGEIKLFTRYDVGGCTAGGYKSLGHHVINRAISFGMVGRSLSAYIDCSKSFDIFKNILSKTPELLRCDNRNCATCYGSPKLSHPLFWFNKSVRRAMKAIATSRS